MPNCQGICKDGGNCRFQAKPGRKMCGKHAAQEVDVEEVVVICSATKTNRQPCDKHAATGSTFCPYHARIDQERREREAAREVWLDAITVIWTHANPDGARQVLADALTDGRITNHWFILNVERVEEEIGWWEQMHAPDQPGIVPVGELHKLTLDAQNVHTGVVAKHTNAAVDKLLVFPVPATQNTLTEVEKAWATFPKKDKTKTLKDMRRWYDAVSCRADDDWLYRRALNGLWARIKKEPELVRRLWEEAGESVGMCCEGHLSRLSNVLVGFDESFAPVVPLGELLQQRMAAIAAEDIDTLVKVERAWFTMEELGVPMEERDAWIEAM